MTELTRFFSVIS